MTTTSTATPFVLPLDDPTATLQRVGGKGASLAKLAAAGLPVPPGFHITTAAYVRFVEANALQASIANATDHVAADDLASLERASAAIAILFADAPMPEEVAAAIGEAYTRLKPQAGAAVAVRSSATAEDLPDLSFAGQHDTYLNVHGEAALLDAVRRCWVSLWTARALGYRTRNGIAPDSVRLAVLVQQLVPADAAGVLFTANPLGGSPGQLLINAAWGLGEAIVSGLVTPDSLVVDRTTGAAIQEQVSQKAIMTVTTSDGGTREEPVPVARRTQPVLSPAQVAELARLGVRIEALYGQPMDVEWAAHDGRLFVLQARPITARGARPASSAPIEVWNDSLKGDYLWTSTNLGEAVPDVMTPCTWSLMRMFMKEAMSLERVGDHHLSGNIGGRFYINLSVAASAATAFGLGRLFARASVEAFGNLPEGMRIPPLPLSRWRVLGYTLTTVAGFLVRVRSAQRNLWAALEAAPQQAAQLRAKVAAANDATGLLRLWVEEVEPFFRHCSLLLAAGARVDGGGLAKIRTDLRKLVSEADTNALLTGLQGGGTVLASLGPVVGLTQLARGEIDRDTYASTCGHRGPHEFEISWPRPAEDPNWIDAQLAGLRGSKGDARTLLERQQQARAEAWERFRRRYPKRADAMARRIERAAAAFAAREAARSEVIRAFWVLRDFVRKAGAVAGIGDDVFFLSIDEILALLGGDTRVLAVIPSRRATDDAYRALPTYPTFIRGAFDPFAWAADPHRRNDVFDSHGAPRPMSTTVRGFSGAAGVVEGPVRVIASPEEGDALRPGEILVTTVTNVGWTPLFPRAAAVITDVGAPLSHAAIVARELGIPAVVGCGNATTRLHTGDRVRVDGERGTVEVLEPAPSTSGHLP
ncbi:MAG: PEP/pyruvate-binding domain-containing protein [Ktedonobacterales bacterium]